MENEAYATTMLINFIRLWDPETGLEVARIYGNPTRIFFSRDGSAIYSVSEDGIVRTWEAPWR
jgi:WD40 repeat protein